MTDHPEDRPVRVVVTLPVGREATERLTALSGRLEVVVEPYEEERSLRLRRGTRPPVGELPAPKLTEAQRAAFETAEVVAAFDLPVGLGRFAPSLRWVQAIGAGTEHFYGAALGPHVTVTNAAGVAAAPIAEFVMGRLLAVWKRFDELEVLQRGRTWQPTYGRLVSGLTLGVVGYGAIGTAVAERAAAFGMRVLAVRRDPAAPSPFADEVVGPHALAEVVGRCDAVVVCAPATPETTDLFDERMFGAMRHGAVFCNVARGSLVDEDALVAAVEGGKLAAAILDVTRDEPLPPESPLWDVPRIHLSPHSSPSLDRYIDALVELFTDNMRRYLAGEALRNAVDRPTA